MKWYLIQPGTLGRNCGNDPLPKGLQNPQQPCLGAQRTKARLLVITEEGTPCMLGTVLGAVHTLSPLTSIAALWGQYYCPFYRENWSSKGLSKLPEVPQLAKRQIKDLTQVYTTAKHRSPLLYNISSGLLWEGQYRQGLWAVRSSWRILQLSWLDWWQVLPLEH